MDIKGDFSGIARYENLHNRTSCKINIPYKVSKFPVELLTLSEQGGVNYELHSFRIWPCFIFKNLRLK
jgi:hypothetical protein